MRVEERLLALLRKSLLERIMIAADEEEVEDVAGWGPAAPLRGSGDSGAALTGELLAEKCIGVIALSPLLRALVERWERSGLE